ncbi:MAG: hypothetical protein IJ506_02370 [Clostridia bacterium]|nr:hypothetical protein [Clostridia bacterium]
MERKDKACWNCGNYKAYYTKGFCNFDKLNYGHCKYLNKQVDKHEKCENWKSSYRYRGMRKTVAMRSLDEIFNQIVEIRQILFEEQEESEENSQKDVFLCVQSNCPFRNKESKTENEV